MKRAALSDESTISTPPLTFGWLATMPTGRPPRRAKPTMISCANSRLISNHEPASISRSMTSYISKYFGWWYGTISSPRRPDLVDVPAGLRLRRRGHRRHVTIRLRHVGQIPARQRDGLLVRGGEHVAAAGDLAVHERAAELLERGLLADRHLDHARAADVEGRLALHHD